MSEFIINGGKSDDNNSELSLLEDLFSQKKDFKDSNTTLSGLNSDLNTGVYGKRKSQQPLAKAALLE